MIYIYHDLDKATRHRYPRLNLLLQVFLGILCTILILNAFIMALRDLYTITFVLKYTNPPLLLLPVNFVILILRMVTFHIVPMNFLL